MKPAHTPTGKWGFLDALELVPAQGIPQTTIETADGVLVEPIRKDMIGKIVKGEDKILAHHYAHVTHGYHIKITQSQTKPILIVHELSGDAHVHLLIETSPGVQATIVEQLEGSCEQVTHIVEADLNDNCHIAYANTQTITGTYLGRKNARIGRDSHMTWFELNAINGKVHSRTTATMLGEGCESQNHSIYLGTPGSVIDFGATADHQAPHTNCRLFTKGALAQSKAIYEGVLNIGKGAPESDAYQQEECLLLDSQAEVNASPRLFINNNDVKCSHAATATHPDKQLLFYLMSRGVPKPEAQMMLIKAFVWPVIEDLPERLQEVLAPLAEEIVEQFAEALYARD